MRALGMSNFISKNSHFHAMKLLKGVTLIFIVMTGLPIVKSAVLEAMIEIESDNIQMTSFLERFKKFIAQSHGTSANAINVENNTSVEKYVQHNDTFQANYDFSQNLLTIRSSYKLLQNRTGEMISDVKIAINFKFEQDPNKKIIIEDFHGHDAEPIIGIDNITKAKQFCDPQDENKDDENYQQDNTILSIILSPVVNALETIIMALFSIIVNGMLGHILTTAFEEFYYGRLLSH